MASKVTRFMRVRVEDLHQRHSITDVNQELRKVSRSYFIRNLRNPGLKDVINRMKDRRLRSLAGIKPFSA